MYFASPVGDSPEARRYSRINRFLSLADAVLGLELMLLLFLSGASGTLRDWSFRLAGVDAYALALLFYVLMLSLIGKVLSLTLDYYSYRLDREYQLSTQRFGGWAWDQIKGFLVSFVISVLLAELLYLGIREFPQAWWIVCWALFMVLFVVFAQLAPIVLFPIFYNFRPLENDGLRERLTRLSTRAGTQVRGVYEWMLSEKSKKANAALTGLGNTRRIILADTLLANYSDDEIEAVLAHELGHHVHRHIPKSIIMQAAISFLGFWILKLVVRYSYQSANWFNSQYDFANLPLIVLVTAGLSLVLLPAMNAYSRFNERQADRYAWSNVASVEPFITAMNKLSEQNLSERTPPRWIEVLFHSHPAVSKRIAAAEAWSAKASKA
ncbi:MAG TPA: M48 family metallopeptidase [Terriglobales bacterium]